MCDCKCGAGELEASLTSAADRVEDSSMGNNSSSCSGKSGSGDSSSRKDLEHNTSISNSNSNSNNSNTSSSTQTRLVIVRHAERLDEVLGNTWYEDAPNNWHDPPITEKGHEQASEVSQSIAALHHSEPLEVIYVSPFLRCIQTAAVIARKLNLPLQIVLGLGECAAVGREHSMRLAFLSNEQLQELLPGVRFLPRLEQPRTFAEAVHFVATSNVGRTVVVVSHREGSRDLSAMAEAKHHRQAYCSVTVFAYCHHAKKWAKH